MELKDGRFYNIVLSCQGIGAVSRAKDVKISELTLNEIEDCQYCDTKPTHRLTFYDCTCGGIKDLIGSIDKNDENIVFAISDQKKFIIKELSK